MPMPSEVKAALLKTTKPAAAALIEDLHYLRETLAQLEPSRGDLRRMSGILRRLLVHRDLTIVAMPRKGKILFRSPDNRPMVKASEQRAIHFWGSGGVPVFGVLIRGIWRQLKGSLMNTTKYHRGAAVDLSLDGFLNQPVICFNEKWINRREVVLYIANKESGVHSDPEPTGLDIYLLKLRQFATYFVVKIPDQPPSFAVEYKRDVLLSAEDFPFAYEPSRLDPVLVELLATAYFITQSKDVIELEAIIRSELGLAGPAPLHNILPSPFLLPHP